MRKEGLRRCGLTPGLAPYMSVITEDDVLWVKPGRTCDSIAKGYTKINLVLKCKRMKTLESDPKEHSKKLCDPAHDHERHQQAATLQWQDQQ